MSLRKSLPVKTSGQHQTNRHKTGIKMNYYTFHSGDYLRDTSHLSLIGDAIYRRCLDWYYTNESPLPDDFKKIARLIRASEFLADVEQVVSEFFVLGDDGWSQSRCDAEISIYHEKAQKARENGQKGGRPKTKTKPNHNLKITDSVFLANQTITESKANQEPITNNQEPFNKNNTREHEKNEQSIIDALLKDDTRKNFTLSLDWNPNPSQFGAYCLNNGIAPNQLTNEILKSFCEKANAKGESKTEAQWCLYLAKYLKTCLSNPPPIKPVYQPQQQPEYSDPAYKLFEPLTEAQKQKTPAEDLQRMKKILMGGVLDNE